jgi:hypothetical protein
MDPEAEDPRFAEEQIPTNGFIDEGPSQTIERVPPRGLFFPWILATMAGYICGMLSGIMLSQFLPNTFVRYSPSNDIVTAISLVGSGALFGGILGLAQWLVLKRYLSHIGSWIPATAIGWGIIGLAVLSLEMSAPADAYSGIVPEVLWDVTKAFAGGILIGLAQWLVIRDRVEMAFVWIPANAVAFAASSGIASYVLRSRELLEPALGGQLLGPLIVLTLCLLIYTAILAFTLIRLL